MSQNSKSFEEVDSSKDSNMRNNESWELETAPEQFEGHNQKESQQEHSHVTTNTNPNTRSRSNSIATLPNSENNENLSRQPTFIERVQSRYSFFSERLKQSRYKLVLSYLKIYVIFGVYILSVFSIYWGSMYQRKSRIKNLRMLVVIEDDKTINNVEPLIGNSIQKILQTDEAKYYGDWHIYNSTQFAEEAAKHNNVDKIEDEVYRLVHQQKYWSSIYVKPNATYNYYKAIESGDTSYNISDNTITSIYETGRDFLNMQQYVTPSIKAIESIWIKQSTSNITMSLIENISNRNKVTQNLDSLKVISTQLGFQYIDHRPFNDPVLLSPMQVGLIYMIIITFFGFNFFAAVHQKVAQTNLKKSHFLIYRVLSSGFSFFIISLFFSFVSLAMQVDFTPAYGHAGFLVYWMTAFITMWAVGAMNEIMAMLAIMVNPPLLGFWLLFWVVINITPTYTPLALSPKFFRYGYALPIHNSYEATKVIFFNTSKYQLGRNYGILITWVILTSIGLGFVSALFGKTMAKRAQMAKKTEVEAAAEKLKTEEKAKQGQV